MKKNFIKKAALLGLASVGILSVASCKKNKNFDENTPFTMATQDVDKVFNPFFTSSVSDSNVVGMTQMGMLGNDASGNVTTAKKGASVVVYDYEITYDKDSDTSTYSFVLRNDVKFSNGTPLTIKDVLFNLYVYLDPVYTGSATLYSTDIVGLKKYRTQEESETEQDSYKKKFELAAQSRIDTLASYADRIINRDFKNEDFYGNTNLFKEKLQTYVKEGTATEHLVEDFEKAVELFTEEIDTDFNNAKGSYEDMKFYDKNGKEYKNVLNSDVEVFLYNEGVITWNKNYDYNGNGQLEAEADLAELKAMTEAEAKAYVINKNMPTNLGSIIYYWQTATNLSEFITNSEMEASISNSELRYSSIDGIKFANRTQAVTVNGTEYQAPTYAADGSAVNSNEVLSITINGVDPKAIWNFAFAVAPMYYYSNSEEISKFDYESHFGIKYGSQTFRDNVIKDKDKLQLPMGAGAYQVSNDNGSTENVTASSFFDGTTIHFTRNDYFKDAETGEPAKIKNVFMRVVPTNGYLDSLYTNQVDYCEPNAKPETVTELNGQKSKGYNFKEVTTAGYGYIGINAGKVKNLYVRQAIMHAINVEDISGYYGSSAETIYRSMSKNSWAYPKNATAYYPCITQKIPADLDSVSPAYADYVREHHSNKIGKEAMTLEEQIDFIKYLVHDLGGIEENNGSFAGLNYVFSIAGASEDHPAFTPLSRASELLNKAGFQTSVFKDANALSKLNNGELAVWAAAWSSTIDPDMYQVYHKDSNASSVKNWGYPEILRNVGGQYDTEYGLLEELSELIEEGRSVTDQKDRAPIYARALDKVMELAVELPTYQRTDLCVYNSNKVDESTFVQNPTAYMGLTNRLWTVCLREQ